MNSGIWRVEVRNREVVMLGERERERENWEDGKIEPMLDTGCRGNLR